MRVRRLWQAISMLCWLGIQSSLVLASDDEMQLGHQGLTGSWAGWRKTLEDRGVVPEAYYALDLFGNTSGGQRRGVDVLGNVDLLLSLDLDKLVSWPGANAFLYGLGNHGGNPSELAGDLQGLDNIEAVDTWKLYEAWIEQSVFEEKARLLFGLYDLNSELEVIPAAGLFLGSSHGIGPEFSLSGPVGPSIFPTTALGARLEVSPMEPLYIRTVVMDGVPGAASQSRGTQIEWSRDDGFLVATELGWISNPELKVEFDHAAPHRNEPPPASADDGLRSGLYGKYAVGAWGSTAKTQGPSGTRRGSFGFYGFAEQRLYFEREDPTQGLSVFLRAGMAERRSSVVDAYLGSGLVYRGLVPGRDRDRIGFAIAAAHRGGRPGVFAAESNDWEVALEWTYRLAMTPWWMIQPDIQYIVNPGLNPSLDDAVVVGVRTVLSF